MIKINKINTTIQRGPAGGIVKLSITFGNFIIFEGIGDVHFRCAFKLKKDLYDIKSYYFYGPGAERYGPKYQKFGKYINNQNKYNKHN